MTLDRILAISTRLVLQVRHDHRSVGLIVGAPVMVMALVGFSFADRADILNRIAPALIATFVLFFTFLLTAVSFLRERMHGTLERMLVTPVSRGDILFGYLLGFVPFAAVQAIAILTFTVLALQVQYQGSLWHLLIVLLPLVVVAVNLGIFVSMFARNEFQVIQFIPIVLVPQIFLSGIVLPTEEMPSYFQAISRVMPLRYGVDGLQDIMLRGIGLSGVISEIAILVGFGLALLLLASVTLSRR
jgi:ABC-2 type transport system permease protein